MECTLRSRTLRYLLLFAAALLLWGYATRASAATLYYIGRTNDRWERRANWSAIPKGSGSVLPAAVPGMSDIAVLDASGTTVTLRSNVRVGGLVIANSWTGSLVMGSGTLFAGTSGIKVGSGRLIGGINPLSTSGSYTQSGGIVTGLQNLFVLSGSLTIRSTNSSRPQFTATGTIVFDGNRQQEILIGANRVTATIASLGLDNPDVGSASRLVQLTGSGLTLTGNVTITGGVLDLSRTSPAQALTVAGNISLKNSANAQVKGANTITLAGSLTVKPLASFAMTGGTMTLNGTAQTLSGSLTFRNFQKLVSSADTLYFYPGYTYTMNGASIVAGQTTNTVLLSLKSSIAGKQWNLTTVAALTLTKVALMDSYSTRGIDQVCQDCTDSGNNSRWNFENSPTVTPGTTSTSGGGGGGGGGKRSTTTTTTTTTPAVTTPTTTTTAPTSGRAKTLQKRIDAVQKLADKAKGAKQKSLLRVIQRLQKTLSRMK